MFNIELTEDECYALSQVIGFVQCHTSPELSSVVNKIAELIGDDVTYDQVVFNKLSEDGDVVKTYKHNNFAISFKN